MTESLEIREHDLFWVLHVQLYCTGMFCIYQSAITIIENTKFVTPIQMTLPNDVKTFKSKQEAKLWFAINHPEEKLFEIDTKFFLMYRNVHEVMKKMKRIQ